MSSTRHRRAAPRGSKPAPAWLLLVHQLPSKPSNLRVRTWRRLQNIGALAVKNSVYALPDSPQAREDFEWMKAEIVGMKGQATVFAADSVDSLSRDEIVAGFRSARQQDFEAIRREVQELLARAGRGRGSASVLRRGLSSRARLLREHWNQVAAIDFFRAPGRDEAAKALGDLGRLVESRSASSERSPAREDVIQASSFQKRTWLTRPRPGIDRMASAWLIRRFIDREAKFRFADRPNLVPRAVPFDMFGVEFSHQGDNCTFETFAQRFDLANPTVDWLGQLVHNLDLKDDKFVVPEAAAVGLLVDGLQQMYDDDQELLERGITLFEALYRSYRPTPVTRQKPSKARTGRKRAGSRKKRKG